MYWIKGPIKRRQNLYDLMGTILFPGSETLNIFELHSFKVVEYNHKNQNKLTKFKPEYKVKQYKQSTHFVTVRKILVQV